MTGTIPADISAYNEARTSDEYRRICELLANEIARGLSDAESKIWHAHPVWFLDGNPIVGYSELKGGIRLMFWSGADFDEPGLRPGTGKFKDGSILLTSPDQLNTEKLQGWLAKGREIQWDYKNLAKRKGVLEWRNWGDESVTPR